MGDAEQGIWPIKSTTCPCRAGPDRYSTVPFRLLPKTAPRVLREIRERIERLSTTPSMCEEYEHDPAIEKLVADKYLVFYRVQEVQQIVEIHRVLRGSWNLPQYLE